MGSGSAIHVDLPAGKRRSRASAWIGILVAAAFGALPVRAAPDFARDIRPIFERHCLACHGAEKQKAGYRLDVRETALKGGESGEAAIVPHDGAHGALLRRVASDDPETQMPPPKSDKARINADELAALRAWIAAGPSWPDASAGTNAATPTHWSLRPLVRPGVPEGGGNPIDAFVRARLADADLAPSPAADARSLIRRVTFDLTGLPPTPEEVEAYVADTRPDAYEALVDRLLASPRHGEHWARHWLDVAHYADTHGNDHDYARPNAWPYRDYVIRAFNDDLPYARFVREQVAGDALYPDDPRAIAALGFLAAGPWDETLMVGVREDTVDHRMAQNLDRDGMVTTVVGTFQSMTVHCARCHDHKFDPISQRDYYGLQAVFAGVDRADRPFDADPATHAHRRSLMERLRLATTRAPALMATLDSAPVLAEVAEAEATAARWEKTWTPFEATSVVSTGGATFERQPDNSWLAGGPRPTRDTYIISARWKAGPLRAMRLEVLPDDRLPNRGPGRFDNGHFHLTEFRAFVSGPGTTSNAAALRFVRATADQNEGPTMSAAQAIDGDDTTHWGIHPHYGQPHHAVFELKEPVEIAAGATFTILLEHQGSAAGHGIGRFRISAGGDADANGSMAAPPASIAALLKVPAIERTEAQRHELALSVIRENAGRALATLPEPRMVYAVTRDFPMEGSFKPAATPRSIHVLSRGDLGKPGDAAAPAALRCVPGLPGALSIRDDDDESARRAALALWLTDDRNVLTWRSIVNRVWHHHFGRGLCDSPSDFGKMGGTPSHPELLDWLAAWFRDDAKGSLKALHRLIVTSETYRQRVTENPVATARDADNRLLWRADRRRLSGEELRDAVLLAGGRLDTTMGGPAAVQFVDHGAATFRPGGGAPAFLDYENFAPDSPSNQRRAVYRFVFRTVADPLMEALDVPDGGASTPARGTSTTALQAFALLNDAFLIRQCDHIAARAAGDAGVGATPERQVGAAFRRMLQRAPDERELAAFAAYTRRHGLANACGVILNGNEFLHLD